MKKFINILFAISVAAFAAVSCSTKEQEPYAPGDPEVAGCYGVYFPTQEASGSHVYSPVQDPVIEIKVARQNTSGSITVPVLTEFSEDGIFTMSPVTFADGQAETSFNVSFPAAEEGKTYTASIWLEDNNYVAKYSDKPIGIDFSVMRVEMLTLKDESGKETTVTFNVNSNFLEDQDIERPYTITGKIEYYEVDGVRYCKTVTENGIWGNGKELEFNWYPSVAYGEEGQYQVLEVPFQSTGYSVAVEDGGPEFPVDAMDYYYYFTVANPQSALVGKSFLDFVSQYGSSYALSYYDRHGGFYFYNIFNITGSGYWYGAPTNDIEAIAAGYTRTDFTLEIEQAGVAVEDEVPVEFKLGPDVAKVVYNFMEGTLSAIQTENAIAALDPKAESEVTESGVYTFALDSTGVYTLVAIAVDAEGKVQNSASAPITYLASEDAEDYAVNVHAGVSTAEEYVPQGINPESALEVYIYGKDLTTVKFGLFSYLDLVSDYEGCLAAVQASNPVSAATLEAINGEGYVDVVKNLLPGTEYYMVVYASNGYAETIDLYGPATTLGDPLPIYQNFDQSSIDDDLLPETSEGYFGKYNFYAVNFFDNETGLREYASKVTIADSEVPDSEVDEDGLKSEYVEISGMFAAAAEDFGFDDTQLWEYYGGVLYNLGAEGQLLGKTEGGYYAQLFVLTDAGSIYRGYASMLLGGFVDDGYIAFMSSELYNGGTLGENGLFLRFYNDDAYSSVAGNVDAWTDLLLVDETKDDNGLAPKGVAPKKAQLRALNNKLQEPRTNFVETPRGYIRSIIDKYNKSVKASGVVAGVKGGECPMNTATVKSVKYVGPVASNGESAAAKRTVAPREL